VRDAPHQATIAVIAADGTIDGFAPLIDRTDVSLVPASLVKGLEYDHVVVVEPAAIVAGEPSEFQGLRRLYVVLTRAVSGLSVVHAQPLPEVLAA